MLLRPHLLCSECLPFLVRLWNMLQGIWRVDIANLQVAVAPCNLHDSAASNCPGYKASLHHNYTEKSDDHNTNSRSSPLSPQVFISPHIHKVHINLEWHLFLILIRSHQHLLQRPLDTLRRIAWFILAIPWRMTSIYKNTINPSSQAIAVSSYWDRNGRPHSRCRSSTGWIETSSLDHWRTW